MTRPSRSGAGSCLGLGPEALHDARDLEELRDGLARLGTLAEPVESPVFVDHDRGWLGARVVPADRLDEPPVARCTGVGSDDAVGGLSLLAHAAETKFHHSGSSVH